MFNPLKIKYSIQIKSLPAKSIFLLWITACGIFSNMTVGYAQPETATGNILPKGQFLTDTIEIGKPVLFSLSFIHPAQNEVFFPDSTFNFGTFQVVSQQNFPSKTMSNGTLDSTMYELISFDVTPVQFLSSPVFLYNGEDSTALHTVPDSIFLRESNLKVLAEKRELLPEVSLLTLSKEINFSFLIGIVGGTILLIASINWVFGFEIQKQWKLLKLQKRYLEFIQSYNKLMRNAREKNNIKEAEKALIVWKNYLERLEKKPFATYTTREIMDNMTDDLLADALKDMDGIVYGQAQSNNMNASLEVLKEGAKRMYKQKRQQIREYKNHLNR
jgi:hypothetical protein